MMTSLEVKYRDEFLTVIENFIKAKVADANATGVVIGVSGGLDSALVLKISTKIYPPENITPIFLPESTTPEIDTEHVQVIAKDCNVNLIEIPIDKILKSFLDNSEQSKPTPIALGNLKARIRMNILFLIANSKNRLVLGTSNKSELMLGYFTKFGDGASDVAPIGDMYKTQVTQLAEKLGLPNDLIQKPPTAGLVAGQIDQDELGLDYDTIDKILFGLERSMSESKIASILNIPEDEIKKISTRVTSNRHKRKFPKIPKLGLKTIGMDLYE
jgi:NAD+ synthase